MAMTIFTAVMTATLALTALSRLINIHLAGYPRLVKQRDDKINAAIDVVFVIWGLFALFY